MFNVGDEVIFRDPEFDETETPEELIRIYGEDNIGVILEKLEAGRYRCLYPNLDNFVTIMLEDYLILVRRKEPIWSI